jgi:hypothetical protein
MIVNLNKISAINIILGNLMKSFKAIIFFSMMLVLLLPFSENSIYCQEKEGSKGEVINKISNAAGETFRFDINNMNLPLNRVGVLADVYIYTSGLPTSLQKGGVFDNRIFLFSAGFFLSGKDSQNHSWMDGVASAKRVQDFLPGPVGKDNDPRAQLYVVATNDIPFSQSWQDWKNAVDMGANFYDGDSDGVYNPVDKNGNGIWDANEDRPDLIGDGTAWCVYNDNVPASQRIFTDANPQGIEIRQTVYGFYSISTLGNVIFVRYEIENKGSNPVLDSVYFSAWGDPDIGTPTDDLVGCDTLLNAGYTYNNGNDLLYGSNPPSTLVGLLQGPASFIPGVTFIDANGNSKFDAGETVLENAYERNGKYRGTKTIPGAKNLNISSFTHYLNGDSTIGDPMNQYEVRNFQLGLDRTGHQMNPCTWTKGHVFGVDCNSVNKNFWYSGDPTVPTGWINNSPTDQRYLLNAGPFRLEKSKPVSIVVAYVISRGNNTNNSINVTKYIAKQVQKYFNGNFTVSSVPNPPQLVSPPSNTHNLPTSITLCWDSAATATSYKLQVAKDYYFSDMIVNDSGLTNNSKTISGLSYYTNYYWRVSAINAIGESEYSQIFIFSTIPTIPAVPILVSPVNGATNIQSRMNLKWNSVPSAESYRVQIATDSMFANIILDDSSVTAPGRSVFGLIGNTCYFWRVNAKNYIGTSNYSDVWRFTSKVTGVSDEQNVIPEEYAFYQNYPNPFNPSTVIKYDLPKEGFVTIKICNILGKEVKTLVNDFKKAGSYNVTFDAGNLPSGIYFCRIKSNDFSAVRKLLLVK